MEILTFPNCRQSIWLAVFFILWTVIVQVICIISGVPSYLCATILYVSTVTILAIAFRTKAMDRSILRFGKPNIKVLLLAAGGTLCLPWVHALIYSIVPFPEFLKKDIHRNWNKRLKRGLHLSFYQRNTHAFYNRSHF